MPTDTIPTPPAAQDAEFAAMLADARTLALSMVPRPRTGEPRRVIDLTATEALRIPDAAVTLIDGYADYGA